METKATPSARLDAIDTERFKAMLNSPSFASFTQRVSGELDRARRVCDRADDEREVRRAQGAVAALSMVLVLPEKMLDELRKRAGGATVE